MINREGKKGFTLIELLVVIAMIGVLASAIFVVLGPARKKSRDAKRRADLRQINTAMELCYNETRCAGGDKYIDTDSGVTSIGDIMTFMPVDPVNTGDYKYTWTDNGTDDDYYCVYVKLESLTNTWFCASNKGVFPKEYESSAPSESDCCGVNLTE